MRSLTSRLFVGAVFTAAAGAFACRESPGRPGRPAPAVKRVVAVVGACEDDALWPVFRSAAQHAAEDFRPVLIRAAAPRIRSANAQNELVQRLKAEGVNGLCIQVADPAAMLPVLESLRSAGMAVVTLYTPLSADTPFLHSGMQAHDAGALMAQLAAEAVGETGTIAVLRARRGQVLGDRLHEGFTRQMATVSRIRILRELRCPEELRDAQRLINECAERFPRLNAWVFLENRIFEPDAGAALSLPPACRMITLGLAPAVREALARGDCFATVVADYDAMLVDALELCVTTVRGMVVVNPVHEAPVRAVRSAEWRERQTVAPHTQPSKRD